MTDNKFMKGLAVLVLLLGLSHSIEHTEAQFDGQCNFNKPLKPRPHSASVLDFGAVGDGETLNTVAFQNAIFYLKSFADKGGAQLYVPAGKWLTGSIKLTSHLTLFLEKEAVILGSQDYAHWDIVEALPSYGRGIEAPDGRYRSLISGNNLTDVVITGNNGTLDGQGSVWWEQFSAHSLNYTRPHLVEFVRSKDVVVSNLTFLNAPAWNIRPVYCSNVVVQNITVHSPANSPYTYGVVPDSSEHVCIENSNISMGHDAVVLKSGWDEYGISYGKPTSNVHVRGVRLQSFAGAGVALGSEMSGGISNVLVEHVDLHDSLFGIELKTARGRGGYIKDIIVMDVVMKNVQVGIEATGQCDSHPDEKFNSSALPVVSGITFKDIVGTNVSTAGKFIGLSESPFTSICLSNVTFSISSNPSTPWLCSDVSGSSRNVSPEPCPELESSFSSTTSTCFALLRHPSNQVAVS
ncbi:probable polygalacturonase isoform X1 [Lycium ferocissimum]|uniref:probable polygalacturonase isoform X1 n=1 Tax=Lycium ferocissimum TaxID=112874 RepID=UPI0028157B65|nr:probable polygalacturonase isoform X1 [Lycium ferocissimum]